MKLAYDEARALDQWVCEWTPSAHIGDLLRCSVGRIAVKELRRVRAKLTGGDTPLSGVLPDHDTAQHIVDWLTADFLDGAEWIERVDGEGRPLKLMKCGSYEQLILEADKAMRRRLQGSAAALGDRDETVVAELAKGFRLVRLLTPHALDHESKRMKHCVGHGAYDRGIETGTTQIYSLRDANGNPCVTMETYPAGIRQYRRDEEGGFHPILDNSRWAVNQMQGPRNTTPLRKHMDILREFLKSSGWEDWKSWFPIVVDVGGVEHDADRLPAGTSFERLSFMTVNAMPDVEIVLPENLTIRGGLDLQDAVISKLPEGLHVGGDLNIGDNTITVWPTDIMIDGLVHGGENCSQELIPVWIREKMEAGRQRKRENDLAMTKFFDESLDEFIGRIAEDYAAAGHDGP
ncbi:hypothetical protein [Mesorhizobium sp. A556]